MFSEFVKQFQPDLNNIAKAVRLLSMDAVLKAKSGHIGLPLGGAEIGTFLYFAVMNYSTNNSKWIDRDRFVLSAGHGSMLQYSLLHLAGFNVSKQDITLFRQLHSKTPGHPEYGHTDGVECTTGPLGQGIAMAVGMAIAERMLAARFNNPNQVEIIDHRTYTLVGDGCLMEGVSAEACSLAGHLKLNRLIVLYDANNITIDGTIDIAFSEDVEKRFEAYGFEVIHADGNSFESLASAMDIAYENSKKTNGTCGPTLIICKGIAGKGSPKWEGKPKVHGNPMSKEDVLEAKRNMGIETDESFFVPDECYNSANKLSQFRQIKFTKWEEQLEQHLLSWEKDNFNKFDLWSKLCLEKAHNPVPKESTSIVKGPMSTRIASGKILNIIAAYNPGLVGGSADLAGSNQTTLHEYTFISSTDFSGRNIHFGVREHAMGAICNGITLHGAFQAYCGTFLVFSDYMRPAIRLAALMKIPTIFIFTHDSFAVGEDGPTHQPVEHIDSLRLMPRLNIVRPADGLETFATWENSLALASTPSAIILTRQDVPDLDQDFNTNRSYTSMREQIKNGFYLLKDYAPPQTAPDMQIKKITLLSSGSEVQLAMMAAKFLETNIFINSNNEKIAIIARVLSCPSVHYIKFNENYFRSLAPKENITFCIEASSGEFFGQIIGQNDAIYCLHEFGASGPMADLAEYFGFTEQRFISFVLRHLELK